jgi:hypothetical protein
MSQARFSRLVDEKLAKGTPLAQAIAEVAEESK